MWDCKIKQVLIALIFLGKWKLKELINAMDLDQSLKSDIRKKDYLKRFFHLIIRILLSVINYSIEKYIDSSPFFLISYLYWSFNMLFIKHN